ncbi:MAG TPA: alpha-amylase [Candidatus Paenibacillus intestinavium]|nr:alpha-amylase [Candidatus Paenibacillus intestinavium]
MNKENHEPLKRIAQFIQERQHNDTQTLWLPAIWNTCGYQHIIEQKGGEILVPAFHFLHAHINQLFADAASYKLTDTTNLDESVIYSTLIRYSTAWDYNHDGSIQSGTFLRTILLLPLMKQMGVNILYMLPITRYSAINLKGDIGSPYAVQSMFHLDDNLHDTLLDELTDFTLNDEMTALVEACHLLDIKVTVDFIPRVTARNSEIIHDHPEWVYWIEKDALEEFAPPHIPELGFFEECTPDKLETVYQSKETAAFLEKFSLPPNELHTELWERLKLQAKNSGEELLELVEREMAITTAPAHSDWINDVQPIWTDITFLRLYSDFSPWVRELIPTDQAPYVLFDTIKCNYYPAEQPNRELWDLLIEGIRYNLNTYKVDGFRIDIGHVLPVPLLEEMFHTIKQMKPEALLISEDLFNRNHKKAAEVGYNIMLGSGWNIMTDISKSNLVSYLSDLPSMNIHIFACAETADTPRITSRGGVQLARMIAVFNHFLPNAIPYITTGFEVNEQQPLNCGLGDNTDGADIPRAFFNQMNIDWASPSTMIALLSKLHECKVQWKVLIRPEYFFIADSPEDIVVYGYMHNGQKLICCFNLNGVETLPLTIKEYSLDGNSCVLELDSIGGEEIWSCNGAELTLRPHQAVILSSGLA